MILVLTSYVEELLPTIISRCVVLNMKPVPDALVKKYLMEDLAVPDYKANICVAFARGNVGKAKHLAGSEEFEKVKEEAISLVKYINDMEINEIVKAIKKITEYNLDINDYLDILTVWYRDVLLFKATKDMNSLVFRNEIQQKVADAGLVILEARITYLAYAPEIAAVMLQRQQASAVIDARRMIVDGAVGMVEMALERLSEKNTVDLDEERKAAMVSNLLVVLCGNREAQPIVNSGSLY